MDKCHLKWLTSITILASGCLVYTSIRDFMSDQRPKLQDIAQVLQHLRHGQEGRRRREAAGGITPQLQMLRTWQSQRLAQTHDDLLANPRYGPAGRFFLEDLYGPHDFSQRDQDILHVYQSMRRFLPDVLIHPLSLVIELNDLTANLDEAMLHILFTELGVGDTITAEQVAEAYRRSDNYNDRLRQLDLIVTIGREMDRLVRLPFIATTLRLARGPARLAGWSELQDFLERGFAAFKHMGGAETFLQTIYERERQILAQIYAGATDPFAV